MRHVRIRRDTPRTGEVSARCEARGSSVLGPSRSGFGPSKRSRRPIARCLRVVVDADYELHVEACAFLAGLRGLDRSLITERVYAAPVPLWTWVSSWLVYAPGMRELIDATLDQQRKHPNAPSANPQAIAAPATLATDLAVARAEIQRLRTEQAQHQQQLRRALGVRLDNLAKADLAARVDELTRANIELAATLADSHTENKALHTRIIELEDDLAAVRTSLRRMIRAENRTAET